MAEAFTFGLAASILLFEQYRSRREASRRKDYVDDSLSTLQESQSRIENLAKDIGTIKEALSAMRETNTLIAEGLARIAATETANAHLSERLDRVLGLKDLFGDVAKVSQLVINIEPGQKGPSSGGTPSKQGDTAAFLQRLNVSLGLGASESSPSVDRTSEALSQVVG